MTLNTPFNKAELSRLKAGDIVEISGQIIVARDAAHKRIYQNKNLNFSLNGECIYYMGPSPAKPDQIIGAAGPTTSSRMDIYTPYMLKTLGVIAMIGKGYRCVEVVKAIKDVGAVYFVAIGGAGALINKCIKSYEILAFADLGAEALAKIVVENMPLIVAIDSKGNDFYKIGQERFKKEFLS
ncbi:FumA C-terminus/TtdB family hydratase beta subunit [Campylobacter majalis]|uniref:FumA C-terminus/TtdB family hydratase beta subunit n=1 Tax=Campylobacter majalis TaxID=2790656 RepID=UPI003D69261C